MKPKYFEIGVPGPGATPYYTDPEAMRLKAEEYFRSLIDVPVLVPIGNGEYQHKIDPDTKLPMYENKRPLVYGLALYLGFCNKESLWDYKARSKEFAHVIDSCFSYISSYHEDNLGSGKNCQGSIFFMKNHGWNDKTEAVVENKHSGSVETTRKVVFSFKDMPNYLVKIGGESQQQNEGEIKS